MRKVVGVLLMGIVVGGFVLSRKSMFTNQDAFMGNSHQKEVNHDKKILEIEEAIQKEYPGMPEDVIEVHNELMKVFYGADIGEEAVYDYARTIRLLYASDFLDLNSLEKQVADLKSERETLTTLKLELVVSKIEEIYLLKDEEGNESEAEVYVKHTTNQGSINRIYDLVKEDGLWKIKSWENQEDTDAQ